MALLTTLRSQLRTLVNDKDGATPSNSTRKENLRRSVNGDQVGGGNKFFILNNTRIVANSVTFISDGTILGATDFTVDLVKGIVTVAGAVAAPVTTAIARYDFLRFLDIELDDHLTAGLRFLGRSTGVLSTDAPNVPEGLNEAFLHEAAANAFEELAARTANLFDASAAGKSINKASIKDHYLKLAKEKHEKAVQMRDDFYKRQGAREAPASGKFATTQRVYTPRR